MKRPKKRHSLRMRMIGINVSIALASFLLYGFLFMAAVSLLGEKYVNHDLDFFLTEMGDNLSSRLGYLESVIYEIRDSEELMAFLGGSEGTADEGLKEKFRQAADISDSRNQGDGSVPLVDKIYLFGREGQFLSDYYYAMISSQIEESDRAFKDVLERYGAESGDRAGFKSFFFIIDEKAYMAYSILDDTMADRGVIIYEVNLPAIRNIMAETDSYEDSFWTLYSGSQTIVEAGADHVFLPEKIREVKENKPYISDINGRRCRIYGARLCLDLQVTLGVQENQALLALYDSLSIYVLGIAVVLLAGLLSFVLFTYKVTKPVEEVTDRLQQVREGNFETKLPDYDDREFHEISQVFNQMTQYINHLIHQVYQKQITIKEMELKFLQTQMNPHFMFNVLNSIALQAKIDGNEEICRLLSNFTRLIQAKIYRSDMEKVKIRQELAYVKYYLEIQNFRYGDRLSYSILSESEEILDMYIPKLCIQLIVENAVVHGLEPKTGAGEVNIHIFPVDEASKICVEIADNGVGFQTDGAVCLPLREEEADTAHNHVGLNNVHRIIRLMYGEEYGITIDSAKNRGTRVRITVPFDRGKDGEEADGESGALQPPGTAGGGKEQTCDVPGGGEGI